MTQKNVSLDQGLQLMICGPEFNCHYLLLSITVRRVNVESHYRLKNFI